MAVARRAVCLGQGGVQLTAWKTISLLIHPMSRGGSKGGGGATRGGCVCDCCRQSRTLFALRHHGFSSRPVIETRWFLYRRFYYGLCGGFNSGDWGWSGLDGVFFESWFIQGVIELILEKDLLVYWISIQVPLYETRRWRKLILWRFFFF